MAIVVSLSRMGIVATLVATAAVLAAFAFGRDRRSLWLRIVAILIPIVLLASVSTRELLLRFAELTAKEGISSNVRTQIWTDTLKVISAYPLTGCGLGAFERGMYQFKTAAPANTVDFAHNDYLQMTAELGVPGVLLLGALVVLVLRRTLKVVLFQPGSPNWYPACALLGAILAIAVHSLADFNLYVPANALAFGWLTGLSMCLTPASAPRTS
jgi:O-antigen ligase